MFLMPGSRARPSPYDYAVRLAAASATPTSPSSATSSTSLIMMGLGSTCKLTSLLTGRVEVGFNYGGSNASGTTTGVQYGIQYGTGTPPVFGAAVTGTQLGSRPSVSSISGNTFPVAQAGIATGLAKRAPYWFDVILSVGSSAATIQPQNIMFFAVEF